MVTVSQLLNLHEQFLGGLLTALRYLQKTLVLNVQGLQGILGLLQVKSGMTAQRLGGRNLLTQGFGIIQPQSNVCTFAVFQQYQRLLGLLCLSAQGADLCLYLGEHVPDTGHIILGSIQFALGLILFDTVFGNARRILKCAAALVALLRNNLGNTALTDDGITISADTRIQKQLIDIPQTDCLAVDQIFTLSGTEIPSGNRNLVVRTIQMSLPYGIIKGNGHLGISHGAPAVRTAEDNVFHLTTTQGLGRDLAQYPPHGVGYVRFSASVGTYDNGYTIAVIRIDQVARVVKQQSGAIREGLEALHFNRF